MSTRNVAPQPRHYARRSEREPRQQGRRRHDDERSKRERMISLTLDPHDVSMIARALRALPHDHRVDALISRMRWEPDA